MKYGRRCLAFLLVLSLVAGSATAIYRRFPDVGLESPFYVAIDYLSESGVVNGYFDGNFHSERELSVGAFCKMIAGTFALGGYEIPLDYAEEGDSVYEKYINAVWEWATENGADGGGLNEILCRPYASLSRGEMITVLVALTPTTSEKSPVRRTFTDTTDPEEWNEKIAIVNGRSLSVTVISGYPDGSLRPDETLSRGAGAYVALVYAMAHGIVPEFSLPTVEGDGMTGVIEPSADGSTQTVTDGAEGAESSVAEQIALAMDESGYGDVLISREGDTVVVTGQMTESGHLVTLTVWVNSGGLTHAWVLDGNLDLDAVTPIKLPDLLSCIEAGPPEVEDPELESSGEWSEDDAAPESDDEPLVPFYPEDGGEPIWVPIGELTPVSPVAPNGDGNSLIEEF